MVVWAQQFQPWTLAICAGRGAANLFQWGSQSCLHAAFQAASSRLAILPGPLAETPGDFATRPSERGSRLKSTANLKQLARLAFWEHPTKLKN